MPKPKTHAIIVAHPNAQRFNLSVARQYQASVEARRRNGCVPKRLGGSTQICLTIMSLRCAPTSRMDVRATVERCFGEKAAN